MAGNIKGIKIEIDGDTQPLQKALKGVNQESANATKELKQIDNALKFDTGNVTLLTQKQEVLQKQVGTTREKLETLRQAQSQVEEQFKKGDIGADQYRAFQREVEVTQNLLKGYEGKLASVNQALEGNGNATKNNQTQLKELQNEQKLLASESEKVVSSFKLQESQMGSNASEADKLALAEKKIGAQSEIVARQIENLEKQLEITKKEYGENSAEANKMEAELKTAFNNLNNEMKGTKSVADSAQESLGEIAKAARAELLQQFSEKLGDISEKLVDVGKEAIEAAASMQASNAQFSTVFGDMEGQAREALNNIGKEMSIVPERLQGSFTQMASFAKTSGLDTAQALDLSTRATKAAADGAAFYDKSIESVTESLQSFLKGNFANDAALGISATETTRNAAANKLYGKSFKDLSEAQKQLTLLQMVEDGNELSGALGQAARESDGLENVMGNLKQSGTNALAALGQPLLEMLIPVFQALGNIIKGVADWFGTLPGPIKEFVVILGTVVTAVGVIAPIFLTLQAAATALELSIGGMIAAALPIIGTAAAIAAAVAAVVVILKYLWETNEGFRNAVTAVWEAISSVINTVVGEISNFIMSIFGTVVTWWTENQELIRSITDAVWTGISAIISAVMTVIGPLIEGEWNNIQIITSTVWEVIKTVVETAINVVLGIIKAVMQIITGDWSGAWETIKSVGETIWNGIASVIGTIFNGIAQLLSNIWNTISTVASTVWNGIKSTLSGIFDGISSSVSSVFNGIRDTISNIWNSIQSTASSIWNGIKDTIGNAINGAKDLVGSAIEAIKGFFNFEFRWPHIPLPHFSITGSLNPVDWLSNGLPSIGVEWYAKGGILTKPTVFGSNGNSLMVGGEAGNEAVLPLNERTLGAIGRGIAQTMGGLSPVINVSISGNNISEEMDINRIADVVAQKIADELQRKTQLRGGLI